MESIETKTKKAIFKEAKRTSDDLVFLNQPQNKKRLSPLDQQEAEYLLWKDNKIDRLIYRTLGDNGWNRFKASKFNHETINELAEETKRLRLFLNSLLKK